MTSWDNGAALVLAVAATAPAPIHLHQRMKKLVVVMGDTGSGKSKLSIDLLSEYFTAEGFTESDSMSQTRLRKAIGVPEFESYFKMNGSSCKKKGRNREAILELMSKKGSHRLSASESKKRAVWILNDGDDDEEEDNEINSQNLHPAGRNHRTLHRRLGWKQFIQASLISMSWAFYAQQTFITVFTDAQQTWHCNTNTTTTGTRCNITTNLCLLPKADDASWSRYLPSYTSTVSE